MFCALSPAGGYTARNATGIIMLARNRKKPYNSDRCPDATSLANPQPSGSIGYDRNGISNSIGGRCILNSAFATGIGYNSGIRIGANGGKVSEYACCDRCRLELDFGIGVTGNKRKRTPRVGDRREREHLSAGCRIADDYGSALAH